MPSTTSAIAYFEIQATGENPSQWGTKYNGALGALEKAFGAVNSIAFTDAVPNVIVTEPQWNDAVSNARSAVLELTGNLTVVTEGSLTLPDTEKTWAIVNSTGVPITVGRTGFSQVEIPNNRASFVYTDGNSNTNECMDWAGAFSIGNTGQTTFTNTNGNLQIRADDGIKLRGTEGVDYTDDSGLVLSITRHTSDGPTLNLGGTSVTASDLEDFKDMAAMVENGAITLGDNDRLQIRGDNDGNNIGDDGGQVRLYGPDNNSWVQINPAMDGVPQATIDINNGDSDLSATFINFKHEGRIIGWIGMRQGKLYLADARRSKSVTDIIGDE